MIRNHVLVDEHTEHAVSGIADVVQRAQSGETAAFSHLYHLHVNQVFSFAARRLGDRAAAEEATQEVFTRALEGLHRCRNRDAFSGWLFGIANHVVTSQMVASRRQRSTSEYMDEPIDGAPGPEDRAISSVAANEIRQAREYCLSDSDRRLLDLILAELTDKEIAIALGRRSGAIRTARWRLLSKLRGCMTMQSDYPEAPNAPV